MKSRLEEMFMDLMNSEEYSNNGRVLKTDATALQLYNAIKSKFGAEAAKEVDEFINNISYRRGLEGFIFGFTAATDIWRQVTNERLYTIEQKGD